MRLQLTSVGMHSIYGAASAKILAYFFGAGRLTRQKPQWYLRSNYEFNDVYFTKEPFHCMIKKE